MWLVSFSFISFTAPAQFIKDTYRFYNNLSVSAPDCGPDIVPTVTPGIFTTIAANAYSLNLIKKNKAAKAYRFDVAASMIVLILYIISNVWFIWQASKGN